MKPAWGAKERTILVRRRKTNKVPGAGINRKRKGASGSRDDSGRK